MAARACTDILGVDWIVGSLVRVISGRCSICGRSSVRTGMLGMNVGTVFGVFARMIRGLSCMLYATPRDNIRVRYVVYAAKWAIDASRAVL